MNKPCDNLQYVFACMSTHSKWVKIIKEDFNQISEHFNLSLDIKKNLRSFFETNSREILISATLFEEKRWREVLPSIKYSSKIIGVDKLKCYWNNYLDSFFLKDEIPKSPILESLEFLAYLLQQEFTLLAKEIFEYEIARNKVLSFELDHSIKSNCINFEDIKNDLRSYKAKLNPSFITKLFNVPVSKIISTLGEDINKETFVNKSKDFIGFYKTIGTSIVKSIHLNELSNSFLLKLESSTNLSIWSKETIEATQLSLAMCLSFIEKMHTNEIIFIHKIK